MTRGVNKVILIGNVGKDPQVRYTGSGSAVCNLVLATTEIYNDKQSGERQERTEWHQVVAFNKLAEIIGQYAKKGGQLYIEGSLRTRKWQDQNGNDRYSTEVVADQMQLLGGRSQDDAQAPASAPARTAAIPAHQPRPAGGGYGGKPKPAPKVPEGDFEDDDIPF